MAPRKGSRFHWEEEEEEIYKEDTSQDDHDDEEYKPAITAKSFERFWSEDQERAILKAVIKFSFEKRIDYASNMREFFIFTKKILEGNFTEEQLKRKLQKLKIKFRDNVIKGKLNFSRHEKKLFRLSKRIWGACSIVCSLVEGFSSPITQCLNVTEEVMDLIGETERVKLENKWKALEFSQLEINMKRAQIVRENIRTTLDAFPLPRVEGKSNASMSSLGLKIIGEGMDLVAESKKLKFDKKFKAIDILQLDLDMKKAELAKQHYNMILNVYNSSSLSNK